MLSVRVQEDEGISVQFRSTKEECFERTAVATIDAVSNHRGAAGFGNSCRGIRGTVVDANDFIDVSKGPCDNRTNGLFFVIHGHACNDVRFRRTERPFPLRHGFPSSRFYIWMFKKTALETKEWPRG